MAMTVSARRVVRNLIDGKLYAGVWLEEGGPPAHLVEILPGEESVALRLGLPISAESRATGEILGKMPPECWDDVTERMADEIPTLCGGTSYMTTGQCAAETGQDLSSWKRWARTGKVKTARFGRLWLVPWGEFDKIRSGTMTVGSYDGGTTYSRCKTRAAGVALVRHGSTHATVARLMGVTERTVYRWLQDAQPQSSEPPLHPPTPEDSAAQG